MIGSGSAKGMPAITSAAASTVGQEAGDPLLNKQGAVIGILYQAGAYVRPSSPPSWCSAWPTTSARPDGSRTAGSACGAPTAPGSGGAEVAQLMTGSPATGLLQPGDVVVALGSVPIRSMADLRGRLYVMAPNSKIAAVRAAGRRPPTSWT